jgi:AIPR protein
LGKTAKQARRENLMTDQITSLEQFACDLYQEVLVRAGDGTNPQMREDAFTEFLLELLNEHNEVDGADVCYHSSGGRGRIPAAKVNAWALSGDGATLDLFVTLYYGKGQIETVPRATVSEYFKLLRGFLRRSREGFHTQLEESHESFEAARRIHEAEETLTTVRLFLITDGVVKSSDIDQEQLKGLELRYVLWDLEKLSRLRVGHREVIELDFKHGYDGAIPCLQMAETTGEYRTFLTFLPGPLLARIYGEYGQRLLERNVRAFLQAKGQINKGIQRTLREEPHRFLAYNNGLCCTAAWVEVQSGRDGQVWLEGAGDFQIVNGGQTTASIFHALKKEKVDISQVVVQVKLTVLRNPQAVAEIVPLISKYANSQNKVNGADLSATGKFHRQMETLSRTVWTPPISGMDRGTHWYYERARGSYLDDRARQGTPKRQQEWSENNPREGKFTKTDLAKYEHTWLGLPNLVCLGAEKNFLAFAERLEAEGEPLVDLNYFKFSIAKAILFRTAEKLFSTLGLEGYRANTVAYAVSWLAERAQHRINLEFIWEKQRVPPETQEAIKAANRSAHQYLVQTSGNVGEWSKKTACWEAFRELHIPVPGTWEQEWANAPYLTGPSELDAVAQEWETLRIQFVEDSRTLGELEALTGKEWIAKHRDDEASSHAVRKWEELRGLGGRRYKNIRAFVELFSAAAKL